MSNQLGPLKKVVDTKLEKVTTSPGAAITRRYDVLECGHKMQISLGVLGPRKPKRRRCKQCLEDKNEQSNK